MKNNKMDSCDMLYYIYGILLIISFQLSYIIVAKADDCIADPNLKQIEKTTKDIRAIYAHPEMQYKRLHNDDKKRLEKKLPTNPELEIWLR